MSAKRIRTTRDHAVNVARNVGRQLGYAVAVHGSRARDLDLIAAPWVDAGAPLAPDGPVTPRELVEAIAEALPGIYGAPEKKPHGRVGYVIVPLDRLGIDAWYIDLSIMPRRRRRKAADAQA
jgi:hypothetical protein